MSSMEELFPYQLVDHYKPGLQSSRVFPMKQKSISRRSFLAGTLAANVALTRAATGLVAKALQHVTGASPLHDRISDALSFPMAGGAQVGGWLGGKIDLCIQQRVMAQNVDALVAPFRLHSDTDNGWRGEFWGKWFTSAVLAYGYEHTAEHRAVLDKAVDGLLATQSAEGDIDTYDAAHRLGNWDVWTRKYVLLGLISYYDTTGNSDVLRAAERVGDTLLRDFGAGRANLQDASLNLVGGLSSSSVLEPVCLLYQRTNKPKYLDFANYIVASWDKPSKVAPHGMHLVEDALRRQPPTQMVAPKAYEMMSCFEGLCELYRITGNRTYLEAVLRFANTIRTTELMVNGSASNQELWCRGAVVQTAVLEQPQETCVTTTWIKLCTQLLRLTGDSVWADEIEISLYNALAGAQTPDGSWWSYFSPLAGQRVPSLSQFQEIGLSCCVANGPRSLLLAPQIAVMKSAEGAAINLYLPGSAHVALPDGSVAEISLDTEYPRDGKVSIAVKTDSHRPFTLALRIPAWSKNSSATLNGATVAATPGRYLKIARHWLDSDTVVLQLDMRGRAVQSPASKDQLAVMRGPILLALDNRLAPSEAIDLWLEADEEGYVDLKPSTNPSKEVWLSFDVPFQVKPYHFFKHHTQMVPMCDYASAGNGWSAGNLYRAWLPQPLYMDSAYPADTWKLMYPDEAARPSIPNKA